MMWIRLFVLMTVLMASYSATAQSWSEIERELVARLSIFMLGEALLRSINTLIVGLKSPVNVIRSTLSMSKSMIFRW